MNFNTIKNRGDEKIKTSNLNQSLTTLHQHLCGTASLLFAASGSKRWRQYARQLMCGLFGIVIRLQAQPETAGRAEKRKQAQRGVRRYRPFPVADR